MHEEKPHILLVEDEIHLARGICFNLEQDEYRVSHVESGEEALERMQYDRFALIILDIMLPAWMDSRSAKKSGLDGHQGSDTDIDCQVLGRGQDNRSGKRGR